MTTALIRPSVKVKESTRSSKIIINVFHCFKALSNTAFLESGDYEIRSLRMPCSSMTRELFLLRAFEAGADSVVVLVCPEGSCDYLEGNIRAQKRVTRVKKILDEIGIGGQRLNIYNLPRQHLAAAEQIIKQTVSDLAVLGRNPAA